MVPSPVKPRRSGGPTVAIQEPWACQRSSGMMVLQQEPTIWPSRFGDELAFGEAAEVGADVGRVPVIVLGEGRGEGGGLESYDSFHVCRDHGADGHGGMSFGR